MLKGIAFKSNAVNKIGFVDFPSQKRANDGTRLDAGCCQENRSQGSRFPANEGALRDVIKGFGGIWCSIC